MSFICAVAELERADELDVFRGAAFDAGLHGLDVLAAGTMARLATDARLAPCSAVGVGGNVVVGRQLAHVAIEAGRVEGKEPIGPGQGLVAAIGKMADAAGRGVVPGLLVDVIGHGQNLQAALGHGREEIIDVLAPHDVGDRVARLLAPPVSRTQPCCADLRAERLFADHHRVGLRLEFLLGELRAVGLHGQAVPRGRPELVELGVAIVAGLGTDELLLAGRRGLARPRGLGPGFGRHQGYFRPRICRLPAATEKRQS